MLDQVALDLVGERCGLRRGSRLLAPLMRVTWPRPSASTAVARSRSRWPWLASWNTQALPSWATFSSIVIRREQVGDAFVDRRRRVAEVRRSWFVRQCVLTVARSVMSFLDGAGGEAADDLAFGDRVEEQRRHHGSVV